VERGQRLSHCCGHVFKPGELGLGERGVALVRRREVRPQPGDLDMCGLS
jgi:hypothetical protein